MVTLRDDHATRLFGAAELLAHQVGHLGEGVRQGVGVFAAGLAKIGPAASASAHILGDRADEVPSVDALLDEVLRCRSHQIDLAGLPPGRKAARAAGKLRTNRPIVRLWRPGRTPFLIDRTRSAS